MWYFNKKEFNSDDINDNQGFVYLIKHEKTGRLYVGKKNFWSIRSKAVKGKTRKKKIKVETDWKTYYGSNKELQALVESEGPDNFTRTILRLCKTKAEMSYFELKEQVERNVLFNEEYFNDYIMVRVSGKHLKNVKE